MIIINEQWDLIFYDTVGLLAAFANDDDFNSFGKICCDITRDKGPIVSLLWNFVEGLHWTTLGRGDNGWCGAEIHNWCRWVGAARGVAVGYSSSRLQLERWSIPCRGGWRLDRPDHRVDLRLYYSMRNQRFLAFLALAFSGSQGKYGVKSRALERSRPCSCVLQK